MYAHDEESFIRDKAGLATAVNATQIVLVGLLAWLATHTPRQRAVAEPLPLSDTTPSLGSSASSASGGT